MTDFNSAVDIANRALQHVGARRIVAFTDQSKAASEVSFVYDKVRRAELRRNIWVFATRRAVLRPVDVNSLLFVPAAWNAAKTYLPGSIVSYNGLLYHANSMVAVNVEPDTNSPTWTLYFGPMMLTPWTNSAGGSAPPNWNSGTSYAAGFLVTGSDGNEYVSNLNGNVGFNPVNDGGVHWQLVGPSAAGQGYYAGELVYYPSGPSAQIYLSIKSNNDDTPNVVPPWTSSTIYAKGQTATFSNVVYQSTIDLNLNQQPTGTGDWIVPPATQTDQMMGQNWMLLGAATYQGLNINYPLGSGPATQSTTRNIFLLPNGFLRPAPQDPKAGNTSYLGAPTGLQDADWTYENGYIVSREVYPIPYRFIADMAEVNRFDDMFCEGMAARIAEEVCEELTQSTAKLQTIAVFYKTLMGEARIVDGIEAGAVQPPEDLYLTCRI